MAYLTKQQVIADFKVNYLPHLGSDEKFKQKAWSFLLAKLCDDKRISEKQRDIWIYPKDL